jgi:hypothetical protein
VKSFVTEGDTLVAKCCDALAGLLLKDECKELYTNEFEGA